MKTFVYPTRQIQRQLHVDCDIENTLRQAIRPDTFIQATLYVSEKISDSQLVQCDNLALSVVFIRKICSQGQIIR